PGRLPDRRPIFDPEPPPPNGLPARRDAGGIRRQRCPTPAGPPHDLPIRASFLQLAQRTSLEARGLSCSESHFRRLFPEKETLFWEIRLSIFLRNSACLQPGSIYFDYAKKFMGITICHCCGGPIRTGEVAHDS